MDDGPLVRARGLSYWYPNAHLPALDGVDLEVQRGEFVLLVGRSGSGKSTLLRALNGLVPLYHGGRYGGQVEVAGLRAGERPIADLAPLVGLVFQDPERQSVMSRVDNEVAFGLECIGTPPGEIGARVAEALDSVGLKDRRRDMVSELSSGQAQRLALADVLAMEPEVLALDEPTSQLDPETAEEFLRYMDEVRRERGTTVLLAEHRLDRGLQLADRVVMLEQGRIVFDGTPREFLDRDRGDLGGPVTTTFGEVFGHAPSVPLDVEEASSALGALHAQGRLESIRPPRGEVGEVLVRCRDVRFSYQKGREVLRGVDLDLRSGEVLVLVGPNGSGKTTLARHLNGLLRPGSGRVEVTGEDTSGKGVAELAREVALLTQNPGDYLFQRSVEEELRLTASYRGLEDVDLIRELGGVIDELELHSFLDRFSWDLSAGQRQRVALGALLVGAPRVLVLDEPTRGMDGDHKAGLASMARRLAASGKAVMVITHDLEFAARVGDRYAVLEEGLVTADGAPQVVFEDHPGYAPVLWRATEGLGLAPEERLLSPADVSLDGRSRGGGGAR